MDCHRRSIRLPGYDYSNENAYFITVCSLQRKHVFGEIRNDDVALSPVGEMVRERLIESTNIAKETELDAWMIMPNHIHFIVWFASIHRSECDIAVGAHAMRPVRSTSDIAQNGERGVWHTPLRRARSLSSFVGLFKSATSSRYAILTGTKGVSLWQRNYYEHVIRTERDLAVIRQYIENNPRNWKSDPENVFIA